MMRSNTTSYSAFLLAASALVFTPLLGQASHAGLFQHLDASVANSVIDDGGTITWLDQSGNGRDATDDFQAGTFSPSTDASVFPSQRHSLDVDAFDGQARMQLLDVDDAATLFDQSPADAQGFSVFVAVRGEGGGANWNDLIGTSSIVNNGFLMRWNNGNGRLQTSVDAPDFGNGTAQNNIAEQANYNSGDAFVLGVNYDPDLSQLILASTHNSYSQTFGGQEPEDFTAGNPLWLGSTTNGGRFFDGQIGEVKIFDTAQTPEEFAEELSALNEKWLGDPGVGDTQLQAGDSDQNLEFDQLDLVLVQVAAKYLTGEAATWGEGDWDGAPGGEVGNPPTGNGLFDQLDIIAALGSGNYLTGPYAAIEKGGVRGDGTTTIIYDPSTGELAVDGPANNELTSINIDSAAHNFSGDAPTDLGGSFDNDADDNIFKATFGRSFGSLSFGNVAQVGLSEDFIANDLTVVGSLAGGGVLGNVNLTYIPEPATVLLLALGILSLIAVGRHA